MDQANALTAMRDATTDESRVAPGQTLCVTVPRGPLCSHLQRIMRPRRPAALLWPPVGRTRPCGTFLSASDDRCARTEGCHAARVSRRRGRRLLVDRAVNTLPNEEGERIT
jgi:hypothetical protein